MTRLIFALAAATSLNAVAAAPEPKPSHNVHATVQSSYGKLPLSFEANQGQTDPRVKFLSRGQGYSLFLTNSTAILSLSRDQHSSLPVPMGQSLVKGHDFSHADKAHLLDRASAPEGLSVPQTDLIRMSLAGANTNARATGDSELPGKVNYFLGNDPAKWHSDLPTYAKVRYPGVYPGIDLVYYGNQHQLEYDFVLAPDANPAAIRISFEGQKSISLAPSGDLILQGQDGEATLHKPVIYQEANGHRQPIPGGFQLAANHSVTFAVGRYDHSRPLIIDPVLVYSTYLGGSGSGTNGDQGNGIAVDATGHAYIVGNTSSINFPLGTKPFQTQNFAAPGNTVFVTKMGAYGTAVIYSTYLGGSGDDFGYGIAIDSAGNAYVTGASYSRDFPATCGALQTTNPSTTTGAPTSFVAKLDFHGSTLLYSTYLGGSGNHATPAHGDVAQAIAVDSHNSAYVTGYTFSTDYPTTDTAFQLQNKGSASTANAFVTKLNPAGTALAYSTYLGGAGSNGAGDYANAIALDTSGDAFITGSTSSQNFPTTPGSYFYALQSQVSNAFVTKLNPTGTGLLYSTYLGGSGTDSAQAIVVDGTGAAYIAGNTTSNDFPLTSGVVEGTDNGPGALFSQNSGAFVTKLSTGGDALVYSTSLEGRLTSVAGLAVDSSGHAYITGSAPTANAGKPGEFIATPHALATPLGSTSGFLVKLDPAAATFQFATLLGGNSIDKGTALAVDAAGNVYVTGSTTSTNFPTTSGAFQRANHGTGYPSGNAFVTKFAMGAEANQTTYPGLPSRIGTSLSFTGGYYEDCFGSSGDITFAVSADLYSDVPGPPPTGLVSMSDSYGPGEDFGVPATAGNGGFVASFGSIGASWICGNDCSAETDDWSVYYSGDAVYAPSSISGSMRGDLCPGQPQYSSRSLRSPGKPGRLPSISNIPSTGNGTTGTGRNISGPKYFPEPIVPTNQAGQSSITTALDVQQSRACIAPGKPALAIIVASTSRLYGSANPALTYSIEGLLSGDTVTVTPQTAVTKTSPAGQYPITATVSGAALSKYNFLVVDGTLTVTPAPLTVTVLPATASRIYGKPNSNGSVSLLSYNNDFSSPPLFLNGTAQLTSNSLRLTDGAQHQAASAYYETPSSIESFNTSFTFHFTNFNLGRGNGMAFVLQNQGPTALGPDGGYLGFGDGTHGIIPGVAIKFDPYNWDEHGNPISSSSTGVYIDAALPIAPSIDMSSAGIDLLSPDLFHVQLSYDGQNVTETVTDTVTHASFTHTYHSLNLPQILGAKTAYIGFSGATGYSYDTTDIVDWSYSLPSPPSGTNFTATVAGLLNGDNVSAILTSGVTSTSPVGTYTVTALVSGPALINYTLTVIPATLQVRKAQLNFTATSENVVYGQTPLAPTAFTLKGFVNGDTASVVSGAPALSTTVTSTTPVGYYPIQTGIGTLTAMNYSIVPFTQQGVVQVIKAPLIAKADNLTMHAGGAVPTLTYSLTGFVNGDTPAASVTGAPVLHTTATTQSKPGNYPITISTGTLASHNYHVTATAGVLSIQP